MFAVPLGLKRPFDWKLSRSIYTPTVSTVVARMAKFRRPMFSARWGREVLLGIEQVLEIRRTCVSRVSI